MTKVETIGKQVIEAVKGYVSRALSPLATRVTEVERTIAATPTGPPGDKGDAGSKGLDGKDGRDGRDGKDGRDGDPGRDAIAIETLSQIDPSKSYPRGTYACYNGGEIRAVRNTSPITDGLESSGWQVVREGITAIVVTQGADLRELTVTAMLTSNTKVMTAFRLPVLIYREIYKEGESYERGDVVTFGGSAWHCQSATKAKPGDGSPDWRLMVKQGREGKAGIDGKPGVDGKPGKDKV